MCWECLHKKVIDICLNEGIMKTDARWGDVQTERGILWVLMVLYIIGHRPKNHQYQATNKWVKQLYCIPFQIWPSFVQIGINAFNVMFFSIYKRTGKSGPGQLNGKGYTGFTLHVHKSLFFVPKSKRLHLWGSWMMMGNYLWSVGKESYLQMDHLSSSNDFIQWCVSWNSHILNCAWWLSFKTNSIRAARYTGRYEISVRY